MANQEHLAILKQGVETWNAWRAENEGVRVDLREVNLFGARLTGADLTGADLTRAYLTWAVLRGARLTGANLTGAYLIGADLIEAKLNGAHLTEAILGGTSFGNTTLTETTGLDACNHYRPSNLDHLTLAKNPHLPIAFLRGCGLQDWQIESAKLLNLNLTPSQVTDIGYKIIELRSDPAIQFHSCFISYSSQDDDFAKRLHDGLQDKGVRCWFAPEDLKIGEWIRHAIHDAIRLHDKLLLILSDDSVHSQWVEDEVESALEKERRDKSTVLFPIRLDDSVMVIDRGWPVTLRNSRHIGDFRHWQDGAQYATAFHRLLRDLKA